ncbi:MAG: hypothetical protein J6K26_08005 [Lachnospiraceae bacterium]|nr:hypothetical protein [Lachnospiraceae bacterium]
MEKKMRITAHNGRAGKNGIYSAKHNDRNFDTRNSEHIDDDMSSRNWYWHCYQKVDPDMTFEEAESRFYEEHFRESLSVRNERHKKNRHPECMKTIDEYRKSRKTCPEEQIMQIGNKGSSVSPVLLQHIALEQIRWEKEHYPNFKLLNVALHVDEEGAPHIHKRGVWIAHDESGREIVGQSKALAEMGISAPDPSKKYGKYNNAKITYTKECREHIIEICRTRGLELELNPKEVSKTGLSLEEYKAQQEQEKVAIAREKVFDIEFELKNLKNERKKVEESLQSAQKALSEAQNALEKLSGKESELEAVKAQIKQAREELKLTLDMKARASEIHKIFGDKETQTYHRSMLDSTRAIGTDAYKHLQEAEKKVLDVSKRESVLQKKEAAIEPLYTAARADREKARDYIERQMDYIRVNAEKIAQQKFDDFVKKFDVELTDRAGRLEEFCQRYSIDGRNLLDIFNQEESELQEHLLKEWDGHEL